MKIITVIELHYSWQLI